MRAARPLFAAAVAAAALAGCDGARPVSPRDASQQQIGELRAAIANDPDEIAARVKLARVQIRLGDGVGAEATVKAALAAGGKGDYLRPLMARAYALQGDGTRAFEALDSGPIAPEMIGEAAWVAGDIHLSNGDLDSARDAYDRAVRELPRASMLWVDVARFRDANADTLGARDAIDFAIELDQTNSSALAYKANIVRTQQGLSASLDWYAKALAADPDNSEALIEQAATFGDLGRYTDMLVSLRHAATIAPRNPRLFYLQAVLAARAGNYALARSLLQRTRRELDDEPGFMLLSAIVELELGGQAVAATWADRLLTEQPNNFTARRLLAVADWADGDSDGAAEALAPVVTRGDADSWSLLLAARVAAETGDREASAGFLARAASLSRGDAAPFAMGDSYGLVAMGGDAEPLNPARAIPAISADIAAGNYASAIVRATRLRDANRGVADAHILLGDAAMASGRYDLAIQSFRAARDLDAGERTTLRLANALFASGDSAGSGAAIGSSAKASGTAGASSRCPIRRTWPAASSVSTGSVPSAAASRAAQPPSRWRSAITAAHPSRSWLTASTTACSGLPNGRMCSWSPSGPARRRAMPSMMPS